MGRKTWSFRLMDYMKPPLHEPARLYNNRMSAFDLSEKIWLQKEVTCEMTNWISRGGCSNHYLGKWF